MRTHDANNTNSRLRWAHFVRSHTHTHADKIINQATKDGREKKKNGSHKLLTIRDEDDDAAWMQPAGQYIFN